MRDYFSALEALREEERRSEDALRATRLFRAAATDPDRRAKILRIAESTGVPADVVDRNLDAASRIAAAAEPERLLETSSSPVLREWVAMHDDHAALARDDVEALGDLERGFKPWLQRQVDWAIGKWRIDPQEARRPAPELGIGSSLAAAKVGFPGLSAPARFLEPGVPQQAWQQGVAQLEQSMLGTWAAWKRLDPDAVPRIRDLDPLVSREVGRQDDAFLKQSVAATIGILPGMIRAMTEGAALSSFLSWSTVQFGGPYAAPAVPAVGTAGFLTGSAWSTFKQEAGAAYIETVREMKARGGPVDLEAAANTAMVAGTLNALLEAVPQLVLIKHFPGLKRLVTGTVTRTAKNALAKPSTARMIAKTAWSGAAVTGSESLTEAAQRGITAGFREVAIDLPGGTAEYGRIPGEMVDEFVGAAQAMWLLGLPGMGGTFQAEYGRLQKARLNQEFMQRVARTVQRSKLAQRMPEKLGELAEKISDANAGPAFVYVPAEAWNTYWQSQEVDPADAAREITGSDRAYREAVDLGADVAVPFPAWVAKVAPTDHFQGLIPDAKLDVGDMTEREATQVADEALGFAKEVFSGVVEPTEMEEGSRTIYEVESSKVRLVGRTESEADAYGKLQAAFWTTRAQRLSTPEAPVSPLALWKEYRVEIARVGGPKRAAATAAAKTSASMFVEDLRTPEDVPRWIRANGGLLADKLSEIKAGTKETRNLPTHILNYKTGHRLEWYAEALVEGGYFDNDRSAMDWIYEAITNPTGLAMPGGLGVPSESSIARDAQERQEALVEEEVEVLDQKAAELGVSARARQVLEEAIRTGAHLEEVEAFDLKPGEIVEHEGDLYKVTFPDPGEPPVLVDGQEKPLGYEQRISVVRLGMPGQRLEQSAEPPGPGFADVGSTVLLQDVSPEQLRAWADDPEMERRADEIDAAAPIAAEAAPIPYSLLEAVRGPAREAYLRLPRVLRLGDGVLVNRSGDAFKKIRHHGADARTLRLIPQFQELLGAAKKMFTAEHRGVTPAGVSEIRWNHYASKATLDGEVIWFHALVKEIRAGSGVTRILYDASVLSENEMKGSPRDPDRISKPGAHAANPSRSMLRRWFRAVKYREFGQVEKEARSGGRGFVRIPEGTGPREFFIGLVRQLANRSTLFHETGHVYLEVLADHAEMEGAPEEIGRDWQAVLDWLGVKSRSEIGKKEHERFARGFERYLGEGKAPSVELAGVFARFRAWLVQIYRSLSALRVELTPAVRGVFDRMLATDAEIASAERAQAYEPLENLREHMSTAEREEYDRATREAREDAVRQLDVQLQADSAKELKEWFRVEKRRLLEEVERELAADRGYRALAWLQRGKMIDGAEAPAPLLDADGKRLRVSKAALVELYGEEFVESIPKGIRPYVYQVEGGLHPDVVAAAFGFRAGDEMIRSLAELTPIRVVLKDEVARRMREQYGDLLHEKDRLAEEAMLAIHSEARVAQMILELRAIERQMRRGGEAREIAPLNLQAFRDMAEGAMRARKISAVLPHVWQNGEFLAREAARNALQAGKLATAYTRQIDAIRNFYMYRAALEARRTIRSQVRDLERSGRNTALARVGLGAPGAREQIEGILARFGFAVPVRPRSESLHSWASNAESTWGDDVSIDDRLFDENFAKPWRELTTDELNAVWGAVQNIRTLARRRNQVLTEGRMVALDTAVAEMIDQAEHLPERVPDLVDPNTKTFVEATQAKLLAGVAMYRGILNIVRKLDEGKVDGPFHRYIWNPIQDARAKAEALEQRVAEKFLQHLAAMGPGIRGRLLEVVHIQEIPDAKGRPDNGGRGVTRAWMIGVALNAGNESNRDRLRNGNGLNDGQIQTVLEHLTEAELDWVQGVIDSFEDLWPEVKALQERTTGVPPEKIQAKPFTVTTVDGVTKAYAGGYFPVVYDPEQSNAGQRQAMKHPGEVFSGAYWRPTTPKGRTKARMEQFARPLLLDVRDVPGTMAQVIHDLAFREAVTSVAKIVLNEPLKRVMQIRLGHAEANLFLPWLQDVANDRAWSVAESLRDLEKAANFLRSKVTFAIMGFKATILGGNLSNLILMRQAAKGRYLASAVRSFMEDPFGTWDAIAAKSSVMRYRVTSLNREAAEKFRQWRHDPGWDTDVARFGMKLISWTDMIGTAPAWLGAYRQAIAEGMDEEYAVRYADEQIKRVFGSGHVEDLPALLRTRGLVGLFTMFSTFMVAQGNTMLDIVVDVRQAYRRRELRKKIPALTAQALAGYLGLVIIGEILSGRGPDEDEEAWEWALQQLCFMPMGYFPLARDVGRLTESAIRHKYRGSPFSSPAFDLLAKTAMLPITVGEAIRGEEEWSDTALDAAEVVATWRGLPTAQAKKTGQYLWYVYTGREDPETFAEFLGGVLYGKRRRR